MNSVASLVEVLAALLAARRVDEMAAEMVEGKAGWRDGQMETQKVALWAARTELPRAALTVGKRVEQTAVPKDDTWDV